MIRLGLETKESQAPRAGFQRGQVLLLALSLGMVAQAAAQSNDAALKQETPSVRVVFDAREPGLSALSYDSLGRGEFRPSPIIDPGSPPAAYTVSVRNGWITYAASSDAAHPVWEMRCDGNTLRMKSLFRPKGVSRDVSWKFNSDVGHTTLLGHTTPGGDIALPALMHVPGMGSLRIYATGSPLPVLHYDAERHPNPFVTVTFPAATAEHKVLEYTLETAAIFPSVPGMDPADRRYDGFRREWLDAFQLQAHVHMLANNSASDPWDSACTNTAIWPGIRRRWSRDLQRSILFGKASIAIWPGLFRTGNRATRESISRRLSERDQQVVSPSLP